MRKRKLNTLGIMIAAAVIIFGVYLIITLGKGDDTGTTETTESDATQTDSGGETTETEKSEIFDFYTTDISRLVVETNGQTLVIDRVTGTTTDESGSETEYQYYELIEPAGYELDQASVDAFANSVAYIPQTLSLGEVEDIGQYGLSDPVFSISVTLNSGETLELNIGDAVIGKDGYYVNEPGSNVVKVINKYKAEAIIIELKDLLSKEIFKMKIEDVTDFMIKRKGEDQITAKKKTEAELKDIRLGFETFKILEPLICDANSSNITTNIENLLNSYVDEYIEFEATDLTAFGLDDPDYVISLADVNGGSMTLEIGNGTEDGSAKYARFKDMDTVFTMANESLVLIDMPLEELVSNFIYIVNITNVDGIDLIAEGYELSCVIEHVKQEDGSFEEKFVVNGKDANAVDEDDSSYFRSFYQSILSVSTNTYEPGVRPSYDPEISITFKFNGYGDIKVDYVRKDNYFFYAFINKEYTGILVRNTMFTGESGIYTTIPVLLDNLK